MIVRSRNCSTCALAPVCRTSATATALPAIVTISGQPTSSLAISAARCASGSASRPVAISLYFAEKIANFTAACPFLTYQGPATATQTAMASAIRLRKSKRSTPAESACAQP